MHSSTTNSSKPILFIISRVSDVLREKHPAAPWSLIVGMRNILVHDYFGVDENEVWATVENDLPDLQSKIKIIIDEL